MVDDETEAAGGVAVDESGGCVAGTCGFGGNAELDEFTVVPDGPAEPDEEFALFFASCSRRFFIFATAEFHLRPWTLANASNASRPSQTNCLLLLSCSLDSPS